MLKNTANYSSKQHVAPLHHLRNSWKTVKLRRERALICSALQMVSFYLFSAYISKEKLCSLHFWIFLGEQPGVAYSPPQFVKLLKDGSVEEGSSVTIECTNPHDDDHGMKTRAPQFTQKLQDHEVQWCDSVPLKGTHSVLSVNSFSRHTTSQIWNDLGCLVRFLQPR